MSDARKTERPILHTALRRLEKCAFLAALGGFLWWVWQYPPLSAPLSNPLSNMVSGVAESHAPEMRKAYLEGEARFASREVAEHVLSVATAGGLFKTDLGRLEEELRVDPWVRRARAELVWPSGLRVRLFEHKVVARWGAEALLSDAGVTFLPRTIPDAIAQRELPILYAENEGRADELLALYREAREVFKPLGRRVVQLHENEQYSLHLRLDDDLRVFIGRKDRIERIHRMAEIYSGLFAAGRRPEYVDLRYPTSIAVRYAGKGAS